MTDETVTITKKRFNELLKSEKFLGALYAAGVDNWDGYEYALEMEDDEEEDEDDDSE